METQKELEKKLFEATKKYDKTLKNSDLAGVSERSDDLDDSREEMGSLFDRDEEVSDMNLSLSLKKT
jgi:hypothetical protein